MGACRPSAPPGGFRPHVPHRRLRRQRLRPRLRRLLACRKSSSRLAAASQAKSKKKGLGRRYAPLTPSLTACAFRCLPLRGYAPEPPHFRLPPRTIISQVGTLLHYGDPNHHPNSCHHSWRNSSQFHPPRRAPIARAPYTFTNNAKKCERKTA